MIKSKLKLLIVFFTILFILILSAVIILEVLEIKVERDNSLRNYLILKNNFQKNKLSSSISTMNEYYVKMPELKAFQLKTDADTSIYLYSNSVLDPELINLKFSNKSKSIFDVLYSDRIKIGNNYYVVSAIFSILSNNKLYSFFIKISMILFVYLFSTAFLLIYQYSNYNPLKKDNISIRNNSDKKVRADSDNDKNVQKITDELKKSASFDQDIVLALVGSSENKLFKNSAEFKEILKLHFPFHDLIFRFNDNTFGLLFPNTDLEKGIKQVEKFDQIFVSNSSQSLKFPIMFGLSSRNGRLISGNILIKEARAALKKAISDKNFPIIGFRPNPALYREHLSKLRSKS